MLSINLEKYCDEEGTEGWLDFGSHKVQLHQERPELYASCADELGFEIDRWVDLRDTFVSPRGKKSETYGQVVAALLSMRKQ